MPSPVGYDYVFGSLHHSPTAQLASTQLSQYLSDLQGGPDRSGPFPLRNNVHRPLLEKSLSMPTSSLLAHSILSSRAESRRESFERRDSLEDPEVDDVHRRPSWPTGRKIAVKNAPILKQFYEIHSPGVKKRVQFADDAGMDLERTRFFTEELDCWEPEPQPRIDWFRPKSAHAAMEDEDLVVEICEWQVNFSQPAADYLGFREKLETNCVGLENVIIKQKDNSFMGTIKVRERKYFIYCSFPSFEKEESFSKFSVRRKSLQSHRKSGKEEKI
jgi:hypothetical protein